MKPIITAALSSLRERYQLSLILLYGSFATGMETQDSDIDLIGFGEVDQPSHDSRFVEGHPLDAWIYPLDRLKNVDDFLHILPFETLVDESGVSESFRKAVESKRSETPVALDENARQQLLSWITKMVRRAQQDGPEANYRYHWLLTDFVEIYCKFTQQEYDGPVKTLRKLKLDAANLHRRYEEP